MPTPTPTATVPTPTPTATLTPTITPTPTRTATPTPPIGPHYGVLSAGVLLAQSGSGTDPCLSWSYTLVVDQNFPSRMAVVKNVLGNSVTIITPWEAPVPWPAISNPNWLCGGSCSVSPAPSLFERAPTAIGVHWTHEYTWTVTYTTPQPDPGPPFDIYDKPATDATRQALVVGAQLTWPAVYDLPGAQFGTGAQTQAPLDIIGSTSQYVNWGLEIFSTQLDYVADYGSSTEPAGNYFAQRRVVALMDTNDTGDVTTIEQSMQLFADGGTNVFGGTPTLAALDFAKTLPAGHRARHARREPAARRSSQLGSPSRAT